THATHGNLNNLVGVPLTLLATPDGADIAVVEMGTNQPGEVARLRAIVEPNVTVVTSIAEEHLEGLGDLAGVMREELAACAGVASLVGGPTERAAHGIDAMPVPPMRSNVEQIGGATLVNDAYNANPGSARAALELLEHAGRGRQRVAILGTMLELGPGGPGLHE